MAAPSPAVPAGALPVPPPAPPTLADCVLEKRLNHSLGCYGCREATDLAPSEAVLGFPGERLEPLAAALGRLAERAVPRSRTKSAHRSLVAGREERP